MIMGRNIENLINLFTDGKIPIVDGYPGIYLGIYKKQGLRKRDYKNHFEGNARKSTLSKSLGSLYGWQENRVYYNDSIYKFQNFCEKKITNWIKKIS